MSTSSDTWPSCTLPGWSTPPLICSAWSPTTRTLALPRTGQISFDSISMSLNSSINQVLNLSGWSQCSRWAKASTTTTTPSPTTTAPASGASGSTWPPGSSTRWPSSALLTIFEPLHLPLWLQELLGPGTLSWPGVHKISHDFCLRLSFFFQARDGCQESKLGNFKDQFGSIWSDWFTWCDWFVQFDWLSSFFFFSSSRSSINRQNNN